MSATARELRSLARQARSNSKPAAAKQADAVASAVASHTVSAAAGKQAVKRIRAKAGLSKKSASKKHSSRKHSSRKHSSQTGSPTATNLRMREMNRHLLQAYHHSPKPLGSYKRECGKFSVRSLRRWANRRRYIIGSGATNKDSICSRLHKSTHPSTMKRRSPKHYRQPKRADGRSAYGSNPDAFTSSSPGWVVMNKTRRTSRAAFLRHCNGLGKKSVLKYARSNGLTHRPRSRKQSICISLSQAKKNKRRTSKAVSRRTSSRK